MISHIGEKLFKGQEPVYLRNSSEILQDICPLADLQ